jgi:hypothetical protein
MTIAPTMCIDGAVADEAFTVTGGADYNEAKGTRMSTRKTWT